MALPFDGKPVQVGRREFIVPLPNLKTLRKVEQLLAEVAALPAGDPQQVEKTLAMLQLLLGRNYPELTVAELEEELDLGNFGTVTTGVLEAAGFGRARPGEAGSP